MEGEVKKNRIYKFFQRFLRPWKLLGINKLAGYKDKIEAYRYEKMLDVFSLYSKGNQSISENYFISNIIDFRETRAQDIMTPRVDIIAVEDNTSLEEIMDLIYKSGFSRLPVFHENLDNVMGFIHIKDLIPVINKHKSLNLTKMVRSVLFISPYMKLIDLLYEMKIKRIHMAMVVDEFGGVDGLITIEDVVEEIVGDIRDEYDKTPVPQIKKEGIGLIEVDGRVYIEELEDIIGSFSSKEENEESNTISGLIVSLVGYIPSKNEIIIHPSGIEFKILSVDPIKINKVMVDYRKLLSNKAK